LRYVNTKEYNVNKVNKLTLRGVGFPDNLSKIPSPPKAIYYLGAEPQSWLAQPKVAIVGSRKASAYGKQVTERLAGELAACGVVVISGLAFGIDSFAHLAALEAGGITVAVLPTELGKIYPASHINLARRIVNSGGTLISEYAAGSEAFRSNFIARNRLISGLADVLVITEAAVNSGSLHTANFALEQGKTVMAVPGSIINPTSEGVNNLIKSGALLTTEVGDVLFALGINPQKATRKIFKGSAAEAKVLAAIEAGLSSQEELATKLSLDAPRLAQLLTALEINGYIRAAGNGYWVAN